MLTRRRQPTYRVHILLLPPSTHFSINFRSQLPTVGGKSYSVRRGAKSRSKNSRENEEGRFEYVSILLVYLSKANDLLRSESTNRCTRVAYEHDPQNQRLYEKGKENVLGERKGMGGFGQHSDIVDEPIGILGISIHNT